MDLIIETMQIVSAVVPFEIKIILMGGVISLIYLKITENKYD